MQTIKQSLINFSNQRSTNKFIDYDDYIKYQTRDGLSFEKDNKTWVEGQKKCIEEKFSTLNRSLRILDICCGDGSGLNKLREMGFTDVTGVEISDEKISLATGIHSVVLKRDICCGPFDLGEKYDIIYSSHSLEHVLNPEYTITNIMKFLKDDGIAFIILPYPDVEAANPFNDHSFKIHCGIMPLGLHVNDEGKTVCEVFENLGFEIVRKDFFNYRENEIHLTLKKII